MVEEAKEKEAKEESKSKWYSRKLVVVLFFGTLYPIMASLFKDVTIPAEAMYIIIAYLLGQSSVDLLKEWLPKAGRTAGEGTTAEQS